MEGEESEAKANRSWSPSLFAKPMYGGIWKIRAKVDWTFPSNRKDKTGVISSSQRQRQGSRAFLELRQSLSFLHLVNFLNRGAL
jgi:hypothetical protein